MITPEQMQAGQQILKSSGLSSSTAPSAPSTWYSAVKSAGAQPAPTTSSNTLLDNPVTRGIEDVFPGEKIGESLGTAAFDTGQMVEGKNPFTNPAKVNGQPVGGINPAAKVNVPSTIGDYLQAGATVYGAGAPLSAAEGVGGKTITQGVKQGVVAGAKQGALVGGVQGVGGGLESGGDTGDVVGSGVAGALGGGVLGGAAGAVAGGLSARTSPERLEQETLSRVTPTYEEATPGQKTRLLGETVGGQPRVQEGGKIVGTRQVASTPLEKEAAKELATVPGYKPGMSNLEAYNAVKTEIGNRAQAMRSSLQNENIAVPKQEILSTIQKAVDKVSEDSLLLQKSDPVIENYMRVAGNATKQADGTLEGVLDTRQALDSAYENARGKLAFDSDKVAALDEVHKAARDSLTQYLIDHAQQTDVKAALRSQWNLYRANDVIQGKAVKEAGSYLQRLVDLGKKHPVFTGLGLGLGALYGASQVKAAVGQ